MDHWTLYEWLLLQFAVLAFIIAIGLGISLTLSKARVKRLQNEFHKMAESIGDLLSQDSEDSGTRLETLLVQTEAHIASLDVPKAWRELDPLEYPHLIPLFMRCSLIEAELGLLKYLTADDYWERLSKAYDDVLFRFTRDMQRSNLDSVVLSRKLEDSENLVQELRKQNEELLKQNAVPKPPEEKNLIDSYDYSSFNSNDDLDDGFEDRLIKDLMENKNNHVDTQGQNLAMLNNVIENQKERIKSLQKDLKRLQDEKNQSSSLEQTKSNKAIVDSEIPATLEYKENDDLQRIVSQLELELAAKNNELRQLSTQLEMVDEQQLKKQSKNPQPEVLSEDDQEEIKRLLIQAWNRSEKTVVMLEKKLLSRQLKTF